MERAVKMQAMTEEEILVYPSSRGLACNVIKKRGKGVVY
jgi:hypothetical protein